MARLSYPLLTFFRAGIGRPSSKCLSTFVYTNDDNSTLVSNVRQYLTLQENDDKCLDLIRNKGKFILYHKKGFRPLMKDNSIFWLSSDQLLTKDSDDDNLKLLNQSVLMTLNDSETPLLAVPVDSSIKSKIKDTDASFTDLRLGMFTVQHERELSLLTRGWSLLKWHEKNNFCANCGSNKLIRNKAGNKLNCHSCSEVIYPTTVPAGIVLITTQNHDKALLVHLDRHPSQMYSCVAGFVDAGETLEDCIRREVAEEAGIRVKSVEYISSQHWPFPRGSLMMGCWALVESGYENTVDPLEGEVKNARWFSPEELKLALDNKLDSYLIPPSGTIANKLIRKWLHKYHNQLLQSQL